MKEGMRAERVTFTLLSCLLCHCVSESRREERRGEEMRGEERRTEEMRGKEDRGFQKSLY